MVQFPDDQRLKEGVSIWKMALRGFTEADVRRGVAHCVITPMAYPPTCAQFREFCYNPDKPTASATSGETAKESTRKCFALWESLSVNVPALAEFDRLLEIAQVGAADYVRSYSATQVHEVHVVKKQADRQARDISPGYQDFRGLRKKLAESKNACPESSILVG